MLLLRCKAAEQNGLTPGEGTTHRIIPGVSGSAVVILTEMDPLRF